MKNEKTNYYSYSASENNEIKRIREKYECTDKKDSKIEQLRKLDRSVHNTASAVSIAVGIIGSLLLGFGMSCVLVWAENMFVTGVCIGIVGIIITVLAYPTYKIVAENKRKKIAPMILSLADELIK